MHGKQLSLFAVTLFFLIISTITVSLRCIVRLSIRGFGIDDGLMALGQSLFMGACAASIVGVYYGIGVKDEYLTEYQDMEARHSAFIIEFTYLPGLIFIKASICCALFRITVSKIIKGILCAVIFFSSCMALITMIVVLTLCKPVSASWSGNGTCHSADILLGVAYYLTISSIITDLSCCVLPFVILRKLQIRKQLKYTLAGILSLGFFATVATIIRACYIKNFTATENYVYGFADLAIWSIVEAGIATTFGSIPSLKPLARHLHLLSFTTFTTFRSTRRGTDVEVTAKGKSSARGTKSNAMNQSRDGSAAVPFGEQRRASVAMAGEGRSSSLVMPGGASVNMGEPRRASFTLATPESKGGFSTRIARFDEISDDKSFEENLEMTAVPSEYGSKEQSIAEKIKEESPSLDEKASI